MRNIWCDNLVAKQCTSCSRSFTSIVFVLILSVGCGSNSENQWILDDLTQKIRRDPNNAQLYYGRASLYFEMDRFDDAIWDFSEVIRLDPEHQHAYYFRAHVYEIKGEYQKAIADYTEAIRIDPKNAHNYAGRASAYREVGMIKEAQRDEQLSDSHAK